MRECVSARERASEKEKKARSLESGEFGKARVQEMREQGQKEHGQHWGYNETRENERAKAK